MSGGFRALTRGESSYDIAGKRRVWAIVSLVVIAISVIGIFGRTLNLGQEFTGGTSMRVVALTEGVTVPDVEEALSEFPLVDVKVQIQSRTEPTGEVQREILVRTQHIEDRDTFTAVQTALAEVAGQVDASGDPDPDLVDINDVGPTWGGQVSSKALRGLVIFLILVTIYISFRFEWKMAAGAILALVHDLVVTLGLYAIVGFVVTPATIIALLTLLGYSLYDTVVVFDKIRENTATLSSTGRATYTAMVNRSLNEVLMRSINTSLSTMLPIGALLFVGVYLFRAETLKDLALAMFIGTIAGAYSSIFVASPFLAFLKEREPRYRALHARFADAGTGAEIAEPVVETPVRERRPIQTRPAASAGRKRRRGKRRR
ncbi:MAG TPA: protein translocase subunit SecF [Actinomycetota bacterium]